MNPSGVFLLVNVSKIQKDYLNNFILRVALEKIHKNIRLNQCYTLLKTFLQQ